MIKRIDEAGGFSNAAVNTKDNQSAKTVEDVIKTSGFNALDGSTNDNGLAVSDSEYVAVQYLQDGTINVAINNDLSLDKQNLQTFKKDLATAEKLMQDIENIRK